MKLNKKHALLISVLAIVLALFTAVGFTLAYLIVQTGPVINTFSPSNIELSLVETATAGGSTTANTYQMVPGTNITKDPKVSAYADFDYYVFVKIEKSENFDDYMESLQVITTGDSANKWTALNGVDGVYYMAVTANTTLTDVPVLVNNTVTVKSTLTKADMQALTNANSYPTLTFTAYAIQQAGMSTVSAAWTQASAQQS